MKRIALAFMAVVCVSLIAGPEEADARPAYHKAFAKTYSAVADEAKELKCGVCHGEGGKNKKVLSDYGKALKAALGAKNVKDDDKIVEALKAVESKEATDGKTYGELLEAGELPPAAE